MLWSQLQERLMMVIIELIGAPLCTLADKGFSGQRIIKKGNKSSKILTLDQEEENREIDYYRIIIDIVFGAIKCRYKIASEKRRTKIGEDLGKALETHSADWVILIDVVNSFFSIRKFPVAPHSQTSLRNALSDQRFFS